MAEHDTRWSARIRDSGKPAYIALAEAIAEDIQTGRLAASERLPPMRRLADRLRLNYTTVARAYVEAQRLGLIDSRGSAGTYVRPSSAPPAARRAALANLVEMTMNLPPEPREPALIDRLREGFAYLQQVDDIHALLRYQEVGGSKLDREAGVEWLSPSLPQLTPDRVLVCPGVQSALLSLMAILAQPGDFICAEAVTYPGVKGIATQLGIRLHGLPADDAGLHPEAFASACVEYRPKALYCNPTLLNPTTALTSLERREAIALIARKYKVAIIEDDPYALLPARCPPPIATLAPELTFYVTGLAKCLGAGLRVAYLVAPDAPQTRRLAVSLRSTSVMVSPLTAALATHWINDGTAHAMLRAIREETRARQKLAARLLPGGRYYSKPEAFHLWLPLPRPWTRQAFMAQLGAQGVGVVASDSFTISGTPPEAVRICLGGPADRGEVRRALELIRDTLDRSPSDVSAPVARDIQAPA